MKIWIVKYRQPYSQMFVPINYYDNEEEANKHCKALGEDEEMKPLGKVDWRILQSYCEG